MEVRLVSVGVMTLFEVDVGGGNDFFEDDRVVTLVIQD